ncbi:hypothetical protein GSI_08950 [Ganoderma sinense ZZ0214-1]|uniref:Uncharacterized protein n=1 Tax=Ganoderma sinense ZZ0214-1 TaxID=1077348 RepID=A0A2G8S5A1_9APHY|nr:hypothetical protein GSI_08950 [Ganoderma sinense ZZ0214-1]
MDSPRTSSSGSSLPTRSESSRSKSLRSSSSSVSRPRPPPPRVRGERDSGESTLPDVQQKLLAHLMPREHHGSRGLRTALAITTERLESETRRADDAERRVAEVLRKLRLQHEATMFAQAEVSRAKEELTLYKFRLDEAQREILRANEAISDLQEQKDLAEAEAARARSTARKFREQQLIARAREEGRQEGFHEGFSRGTNIGFDEAAAADSSRDRRYGVPTIEEVPEEGEPRAPRYRAGTPGPTELRVRAPAPEYYNRAPAALTVPSERSPPPAVPPPRRPPSRSTLSRASQRNHVPDVAHHAPTLPVPTLVTPLNVPSPSHSRADTPIDMPVAHPAPRSLDDGEGEVPPPVPIHERAPSPAHPPVDVPPDGWIPLATGPNQAIFLPPPHELSRPVTPVSPTPPPPPMLQSAEPPQPVASSSAVPPPPQLISRDYAEIPVEGIPLTRSSASTRPMSPQSKASTTISQFDITNAPPRAQIRVSTSGRAPREDRQVSSPRGPRPRDDLPFIARSRAQEDSRGSQYSERSEREKGRSAMNPLEKLFKKRFLDKSQKESPPITPPVVPAIRIEAPSTPSTPHSSIMTTGTHPAFLSPELAAQQIAPLAPQDNIIIMRTEIPGYYPTISVDQPFVPPRPESIPADQEIPPPSGQFPRGFVPLTPPQAPSTLVANPIPVPSNTPVPVPPPSNPIPVPSNTPVPIPPPSNPLPVPMKEVVPIPTPHVYHTTLLPIPENGPIPVPVPSSQRGARTSTGSPRAALYDEAPIPAGVVYPEPPSRRVGSASGSGSGSGTGTPASSLSPKSQRGRLRRLDMRSPGANLSPLPMQFQFFAPLKSDTTSESMAL